MGYCDYRMWVTIAIESFVEYSLGFKYWWLNAMFQHTWTHIEAITHEWYHVPLSQRATYFKFPPIGWFWFFMEWIGMIDTVKHMGHHGHDITNQLEVDDFFDMWVPSFMIRFADNIWATVLKKFEIVEPMTAPIDHPQFSPENKKKYHEELNYINIRNYIIASIFGIGICCIDYEKAFTILKQASVSVGVL